MAQQSMLFGILAHAAKFRHWTFSRSLRTTTVAAKRKDCVFYTHPKCSEEVLAKKRKIKKCVPFDPVCTPIECCYDFPCKTNLYPPFDDLYYRPSDKNRRYQRTWAECPKLRLEPRPVCCYEHFDYRKPKRRRRRCTEGEYSPNVECAMRKLCPNLDMKKCPRLNLPGCSKFKCNTKCKRTRLPEDCKKVCTPYPSFSECKRDRPKPLRPVECKCWVIPDGCYYR